MIDFKYLMNPEKYHTVPPRAEGEKDEQYKARLKAYVGGVGSQQAKIDELNEKHSEEKRILHNVIGMNQAKIDELQARVDKVVHILTYTNHASTPLCNELRDILKGNKYD